MLNHELSTNALIQQSFHYLKPTASFADSFPFEAWRRRLPTAKRRRGDHQPSDRRRWESPFRIYTSPRPAGDRNNQCRSAPIDLERID